MLLQSHRLRFALVVPTLNASACWDEWLTGVRSQTLVPEKVLVIDSDSTDATASSARAAGFLLHTIRRQQFNHGGTRQLGVQLLDKADVIVFLTQDAILASPTAFEQILDCFSDPAVGAAYGRQLPHIGSSPIAAHARLFNYPAQSRVQEFADRQSIGIKAAFISNSFAAYRRSDLVSVGGFPNHTILSEDLYVAAKLLKSDHKIVYCAEATAYHSHDYSPLQEFKRYFDQGVFHGRERWIRAEFGEAEKEGLRFIFSELRYLWKNAPLLIPSACVRTLLKYVGYRLGLYERWLPRQLKRRISMFRAYWDEAHN